MKEGKRGRAGGQDRHRGDRCCRDRCCMAKLGQGMVAGRGQAFCCAALGGLAAAMGLVGRQPSRRPRADGVAAKRSHPVVLGVAGSSCKKQTALLTHGMSGRAGTPAPSHLHPARAPARSRWPPPAWHLVALARAGSAPRWHSASGHPLRHPPGRRAAPRHQGGCGRCGHAAGTWERADKGPPPCPPTTLWAHGSTQGGCLVPSPDANTPSPLQREELSSHFWKEKHHPQLWVCTRWQGRMRSVPLPPNSTLPAVGTATAQPRHARAQPHLCQHLLGHLQPRNSAFSQPELGSVLPVTVTTLSKATTASLPMPPSHLALP